MNNFIPINSTTYVKRHYLKDVNYKKMQSSLKKKYIIWIFLYLFKKLIFFVVKSLPAKKTLDSDDFPGEFLQTFKEVIVPIEHKVFQTSEGVANFPTHSVRP